MKAKLLAAILAIALGLLFGLVLAAWATDDVALETLL